MKVTAKNMKKVTKLDTKVAPATEVGCCRSPEEQANELKQHYRMQLAIKFYEMRLHAALNPETPGIADHPLFANINAQRAVRDADQLLSMLDMPFGAFDLGAGSQTPPVDGPMNAPVNPVCITTAED